MDTAFMKWVGPLALTLALAFVAGACEDAGTDGLPDAESDAGADTEADTGDDVEADVDTDASGDVGGTDADPDAGGDVGPDEDGDGHADSDDNCPSEWNADQANLDGDALGDACDDDVDGDGLAADADCDDRDADVTVERAFFEDADLDGLGDPASSETGCTASPGYVANADDAEPSCRTNDTDECGVCAGPGPRTWYGDGDGDLLGDPALPATSCEAPAAYVDNADDTEPDCSTNDTDACGVCAGPGTTTYYADHDDDGLGDPDDTLEACALPEGYVLNTDDTEPDCTTNDSDECGVCAGPGRLTVYPDGDGDGLGDVRSPLVTCGIPEGYVDNGDDPEVDCRTNDTDDCGVCGGGNRDLDCLGVCFGESLRDGCFRCVGGTSGVEPETEDYDEDGIPDSCDSAPPDGVERMIVQWDGIYPPDREFNGGPYTFQLILLSTGDVMFQYFDMEEYMATPTVGYQGPLGANASMQAFENDFPVHFPVVDFTHLPDGRLESSFFTPMNWIDISQVGTRAEFTRGYAVVHLDWGFPFQGRTYSQIGISPNGFVLLEPPRPLDPHLNRQFPVTDSGPMIAPFWEGLDPELNGAVYYFVDGPEYVLDCDGMRGGAAIVNECGVCVGGTTGVGSEAGRDCNGDCGGGASIDACGTCSGGLTGIEPNSVGCDVGPDLIVDLSDLRTSLFIGYVNNDPGACYLNEGCLNGTGRRKVLRFTTTIANIGNDDMRIGNPPNDVGADNDYWIWDPCHSHWHYEGYASYDLYDVANDVMVPIGQKTGFCVIDIGTYDRDLTPPGGCRGYNCGGRLGQGITRGCYDTYHSALACQWIDITGVADGVYDVIVTTNPDGRLFELDYENNSATVRVRIEGDSVTLAE
jgi:hypothetical protein